MEMEKEKTKAAPTREVEKELAWLIKKAGEIREASWSDKTSQYGCDEGDAIMAASGKAPTGNFEDLDAIPFGYPAYLLITYSWNDALGWADMVMEEVSNEPTVAMALQ